jgi:hypothetical protein
LRTGKYDLKQLLIHTLSVSGKELIPVTNFLARQHYWNIEVALFPRNALHFPEFLFQHVSIQKQQDFERLILAGCRNLFFDREIA